MGRGLYQNATGAVTVPLPDTELTAVFRLAKVAGSSGCNTYQGPYTTNEHDRRDRPAGDDPDGLRR